MKLQKRSAAKILKVGKNKIWFNPDRLSDIKEAITKEDIRDLIKDGAIKGKEIQGISKGRFRKRLLQKRKGMRKGTGKRKGKRVTIRTGKKVWIKKARLFRNLLGENRKELSKEAYQKLRGDIKAGSVKDKKNLLELIKQRK